MSKLDFGEGAREKSSPPVPHFVADTLLPGLQRFEGAPRLTDQEPPIRPIPACNVESHTSWYGFFRSGENGYIVGRRFFDRIDSRNPLGSLVATRALVSSMPTSTNEPHTVEPSGPRQTNSYIILIGRDGGHGLILRASESERKSVEDLHCLAVDRLNQELASRNGGELPEARTARWLLSLARQLGFSCKLVGEPAPS
jgi:hypothetical protein